VEGQKDYPVIFGQLTQRDGSFLVAKDPDENFSWDKLDGKHVLAGRKGGMPAMTLQYVLNQRGIDTSGPNFDTTVQFDVMVGGRWRPTRIEYAADWYLVGIRADDLNGLRVRI
jgi:NitT/TauT family transport system substrate-binding protein